MLVDCLIVLLLVDRLFGCLVVWCSIFLLTCFMLTFFMLCIGNLTELQIPYPLLHLQIAFPPAQVTNYKLIIAPLYIIYCYCHCECVCVDGLFDCLLVD